MLFMRYTKIKGSKTIPCGLPCETLKRVTKRSSIHLMILISDIMAQQNCYYILCRERLQERFM